MTTIAVTGHMDLTTETVALVRAELRALLGQYAPADLVGVSCIAAGSDSLFAEAVLDAGGQLVVVVPGRDYRERKVKPDEAELYDRLVTAAAEVHTVPIDRASREAYEAAGAELLRRADRMVAIWDGQPSNGRGGTAHTVDQARAAGVPVDVVWPDGAARR
ncbi:hypothetical protein RM844_28630 [Streptomyces sp. DSM 44915]|uniref:DUF1273 family protein n=1 Tax=Streptomyces chisholmiae TaxID=3075540 RepID=A0ABU2JZ09_9ACTN|nr:hypothetical protein [Streptomyces sp. DSM 44915]MDT0270243.1 hypothetical protein [Streptomyces sp. DSM 44915]